MFPFSQIIFGSLFLLISYQYGGQEASDRNLFIATGSQYSKIPEYDFIVVGGGLSGSVVANRLSERFSVLLLEAGGNPVEATRTPAHFPLLNQAPQITYQFASTRQQFKGLAASGHAPQEQLGTLYSAQGKALGGSSTINAMMYNRGSPRDYDRWVELTGDEAWSYKNLLPLFQKIEKHQLKPGQQKNDHLGYSGVYNLVSNVDSFEEKDRVWEASWRKAGLELGHREYENTNGPQTANGFGPITENKLNGRRFDAFSAFLEPIMNARKNLVVQRFSQVTQIKFDEKNRAYGVLYDKHGINWFAKAKHEIILSAGAFNSPKILLRSGVGPQKDLTEAGIKVVANVPVGQKFQDHPTLVVNHFVATKTPLPYASLNVNLFEEFAKNGTGYLSNTMNMFAQAFIVSKKNEGGTRPDYTLFALSTAAGRLSTLVQLTQPTSFGTLTLNKTDPHNSPLIWDANLLDTKQDVEILKEALQEAHKVYQTDAFKALGVQVDNQPIERCSGHAVGSDGYWLCFMNQVATNNHPTTTCTMGKTDDPTTVVDSKLRVLGVEGLRVIDNSVQPSNTNGNAALVIGQRGSEFILEQYSQ